MKCYNLCDSWPWVLRITGAAVFVFWIFKHHLAWHESDWIRSLQICYWEICLLHYRNSFTLTPSNLKPVSFLVSHQLVIRRRREVNYQRLSQRWSVVLSGLSIITDLASNCFIQPILLPLVIKINANWISGSDTLSQPGGTNQQTVKCSHTHVSGGAQLHVLHTVVLLISRPWNASSQMPVCAGDVDLKVVFQCRVH